MVEIYGTAFGNFLSCYWHCRYYSLLKKKDFNLFDYLLHDTDKWKVKLNCIKSVWTKFLPFNVKYNSNFQNYKKKILYIDDWTKKFSTCKDNNVDIDEFMSKNKKVCYLWSHQFIGSWTEYIDFINLETDKAINLYLKEKNTQKPKYEDNEVVIHYRVGNVINGKTNPAYPALKFKYFLQFIPKETKKITIIWKINYGKVTEVETGDKQRDRYVIESLKKYLEKNLNISVEINNTYFCDFIYMVYAPILITTPSTFSFWPAVMSKNKCYVPSLPLLCSDKKPKIRDNFTWTNIDNLNLSVHVGYHTRNNNVEYVKRLGIK